MQRLNKNIKTLLKKDPKILIVLTGSLGDIARGLSLVKPIKDFWPKAHLVWVVEDKWADFLRLNPYIDELIIFKRSLKPANLLALRKNLKKHKFDISLDLQRIFKSGILSMWGGAKIKLGFNPSNAKEYNHIFNNHHIPPSPDTEPKWRHYLRFLEYLGVPYPKTPSSGIDKASLNSIMPDIISTKTEKFAVLAMGSSWESKNWTADGYRELTRRLKESYGLDSVLVGDALQMPLAAETAAHSDYITNLTGATTLPQLAAVLSKAALAVGPDSGAGHIAASLGTPYIALFGPTSHVRTAPYNCADLVVSLNYDCGPCYHRQCKLAANAGKCMQNIAISDIEPKINLALARDAHA